MHLVAALVSAVAYSGMDLTRKFLTERVRSTPLLFYLAAVPLPFFVAWTAVDGMPAVGPGYYLPAALSVLLNIGANLLFLESIRLSPLSLTIPFLSWTPVFTTFLAIPMLGEAPTKLQLAGILLVVVGAFRLNLPEGGAAGLGGVWRAFARERGSVLMVVVALFWSLAMPLDKIALGVSSVPFHGAVLNCGVALGVLALLAARRRLGELALPRETWGMLSLSVLFTVVALGAFLIAITGLLVGLVETLKRAIGSSLALGLGYAFFRERITANRIAAVVLMAVGVALVLY